MTLGEFEGLRLADFDDRLVLQKRVYLLQNFGFSMGYRYNWYVRGPYSPQLTEDAFAAQARLRDLQRQSDDYSLTTESLEMIATYKAFENRLGGSQLPLLLELAASIHYLRHVGFLLGGKEPDNIAKSLQQRGKSFTEQQFSTAWDALNEHGLIESGVVT